MGSWTKEVKLPAIVFDGDSIVVTVNRLLADDMAVIMSHYDAEKKMLVFTGGNAEMSKLTADIFPKYITNIEGMTKGDGLPFGVGEFMEVAKESYFSRLIGQLLAELIRASSVGAEVKNLESPAPSNVVGSGEQASST